jgi:hypothetical protein
MKLRSRKQNAYAADHPNIKHSSARNIHAPTSPKTLLLQETENKSNASAPLIVNNIKPAYLSRYLARRERMDKQELGMQSLGMRALMATLDEIQPHQISLMPRVVLESPTALMSTQYLCGMARPD